LSGASRSTVARLTGLPRLGRREGGPLALGDEADLGQESAGRTGVEDADDVDRVHAEMTASGFIDFVCGHEPERK
jgi:hypothetical protein